MFLTRAALRRITVATIALSCSLSAFAGGQSGKVTNLWVRSSDGLHYFTLDGVASGKPACAVHGYWMIRDENSQSGRDQYALILSAFATGQSIKVGGRNTCQRWADGEDVDTISVSK